MKITPGIMRHQVYKFVLETKTKGEFSCDIVAPITTSKNYFNYEHSNFKCIKENHTMSRSVECYYDNILMPAA